VLVTSDYATHTLTVWNLRRGGDCHSKGLQVLDIFGGKELGVPMQFTDTLSRSGVSGSLAFSSGSPPRFGVSGFLAFSPSGFPPLLLVTDHVHAVVHVVDVVDRAHKGYLTAPERIPGPRGVAVAATATCAGAGAGLPPFLVAVSSWKDRESGDHTVFVFEGTGALCGASLHRIIGAGYGSPGKADGQLHMPYGLCFDGDGGFVCVTDQKNHRISMFDAGSGGFVRHVVSEVKFPRSVERVPGGWVVAGTTLNVDEGHYLPVFDDDGGFNTFLANMDKRFYETSGVARVPGLGLAVLGFTCVQVFTTPELVAMWDMSPVRVAWIAAVVRNGCA
jgi:hypothetical protein